MKAAISIALVLALFAPEGANMLRFNDQQFELKYAYAFKMKVPDMDAMTPQDMQAGRTKWKQSLSIALSDHPFDTAALAKAASPESVFEQMQKAGAALVILASGKTATPDMVQVALPKKETALSLDTSVATLTVSAPKDGKLSGHLVIKGDKKMHDFDPQNIPLVEADLTFTTAAP